MTLRILIASVLANALLGWLWLEARENLAAERVQCNADKLQSVAEARQIAAEATQRAADARIAAMEARHQDTVHALQIAAEEAREADEELADAAVRIRELELEAEFDEEDLPDSGECLNVFVPARVLYAENCGETGAAGDNGGEVCADPGSLNAVDETFATITYGDAMKLWKQDRTSLQQCGANLDAVKTLQPPH